MAIIAALYFMLTGKGITEAFSPGLESMFKDKTITQLRDQHCTKNPDGVKCLCIVQPVYDDLMTKYDSYEIQQLEKNEKDMLAATKASFKEKKSEIQECLKGKSEGGVSFIKKIIDFF